MTYQLKELSPEDQEKVTEELKAVLEKYDCEMGVTSSIQILRRVEDSTLSPIQPNDLGTDDTEDNSSSTPA